MATKPEKDKTPAAEEKNPAAKAGGAGSRVSDKRETKKPCVKHTETRDRARFSIDSPLATSWASDSLHKTLFTTT